MAIRPNFNAAQVASIIKSKVDNIERSIITRFSEEGERFVANARSINTYSDQSNNLRSSIGYVILKDGRQIVGFFPGKTAEGVAQAKKTASDAAKKHTKGYVLIVVAGMDYAHAVESGVRKKPDGTYYNVKPQDVLSGSAVLAKVDIKRALEKLAKKI